MSDALYAAFYDHVVTVWAPGEETGHKLLVTGILEDPPALKGTTVTTSASAWPAGDPEPDHDYEYEIGDETYYAVLANVALIKDHGPSGDLPFAD